VLAQGYGLTPWPAGQPRPSLAATDLQGQHWKWADLRGRAVLINFWASWCEPCLAEMPSMQQLAREQGSDRLVVLTVNFKEPEPRIQRFVQQTGLVLPVIPDPAGEMARAWGVTVFPSTVLVGADGRVRSVLRGELDWTSPQAVRLLGPLLRR
jgi:thiol-disulfide isomerase/thioredoxin